MRILVIDDEPAVSSLIAEALQRDGNDVVVAGSGEEGLAALDQTRPDAVILDIVMPGMDGIEVLRRIRRDDSGLPVVIMSGWATDERIDAARKLGVTDVVPKPIALKNLTRAVAGLRRV